jgi:DNA-3-methyladenine glycosylase
MTPRAAAPHQTIAGRPARPLPRAFYLVDALTALPALMGKILVNDTPEGRAAGRIVEAEAYLGASDKAAHSYRGRTRRTEIQWAEGGHAYIYTIHTRDLFNVTLGPPEVQDCVLIRALEPLEGIDLMRRRRGVPADETGPRALKALCSGPGKLCQALGISRALYGWDLTLGEGLTILDDGTCFPPEAQVASPRIGIDYAEEHRDLPWRLHLDTSPHVSKRPSRRKTGA